MMRTVLMLLSVAVTSLLGANEARASERADQLAARGTGSVAIDAGGTVEFTLSGAGTLAVPDARRLDVRIDGRGDVDWGRDGTLTVANFVGTVRITGRTMSAGFRGGSIGLTADGHGRAVLTGTGHWQTNDASGRWTDRGAHVRW